MLTLPHRGEVSIFRYYYHTASGWRTAHIVYILKFTYSRMNTSRILISIDLEELHLQAGNNRKAGLEEGLQISQYGLGKVLTLLDRYQVRATFFMTAVWAKTYPIVARELASRHEVGAYGCVEKHIIEQLTGSRVYGCRMEPGTKPDYKALKTAGYVYHSGGQGVRPMTIADGLYEIYAERVRPLWITRLLTGGRKVIALRFNSGELGVHPTSLVGNPRLEARLDSVLVYLQRKGLFMPHIEWLQEQLSDEQ